MKKKIMATVFTATLTLAVVTNGMTLWYAGKGTRGTKIYVEASFTSSQMTFDDEDGYFCGELGLKPNKYVDSVTIRLKEGDYDKSKTSTTGSLVKLEKTNNPFKTSSASWNWKYLPTFK